MFGFGDSEFIVDTGKEEAIEKSLNFERIEVIVEEQSTILENLRIEMDKKIESSKLNFQP
jgi:hypothetical protein